MLRMKMGLRRLAISAALLGALAGLTGCGRGQEEPTTGDSRSSGSSRRPPRAADADVKESLDLASFLTEIPEYAGSGRNLFAYGSRPTPTPPTPPRNPRPSPPPPSSTTRPTTTGPVRIDLKFTGYVETKTPGGEKKKYAVFLNGQEILTGAEGDLVANRYKIVQIGLESVTVGVAGSSATQRIPLRSN
jgi:hypothetical protein